MFQIGTRTATTPGPESGTEAQAMPAWAICKDGAIAYVAAASGA